MSQDTNESSPFIKIGTWAQSQIALLKSIENPILLVVHLKKINLSNQESAIHQCQSTNVGGILRVGEDLES